MNSPSAKNALGVKRHGCVSVQRFFIYAERGLAKKRVAVWLYQDRLHVEYQHTVLARYQYRLDRKSKKITDIKKPSIYKTLFASPQVELFELDDDQWHKILKRPEYAKRRRRNKDSAKQLALAFHYMLLLILLGILGSK